MANYVISRGLSPIWSCCRELPLPFLGVSMAEVSKLFYCTERLLLEVKTPEKWISCFCCSEQESWGERWWLHAWSLSLSCSTILYLWNRSSLIKRFHFRHCCRGRDKKRKYGWHGRRTGYSRWRQQWPRAQRGWAARWDTKTDLIN